MAAVRYHPHAWIGRHTTCSRSLEHSVRHATLLVNRPRFHAARGTDEVQWQGGRVYLHLGARREDPLRR
jgi:hypothetical protein